MEKISWTDSVEDEEALCGVKGEINILRTVRRRKAGRIGHILSRNSLLKDVIEGKLERKMEMTGQRENRRK
jgi:hypothetical protein